MPGAENREVSILKIYIFGSCSGTEPWQGRHHTAFAIEIGGRFYWFDAGENCSYAAHLMGVDLLSVSDIFISHPHMDHVGGLGNLLWNIRKLTTVKHEPTKYGDVTVHIPVTETFDGMMAMLRNTEGYYKCDHETLCHKIEDGVVLENADVTVTALHNNHLSKKEYGWRSFSFLIEAEGKRIVYSGDVGDLDDVVGLFGERCDLLLMETGHHDALTICERIKAAGYPVRDICFTHHGLGVLHDYDGTLERCRRVFPTVRLANDGDVYEL